MRDISLLYERAKREYFKGANNAAEVVELLSPYLKVNSEYVDAWNFYGDSLRLVGRVEEAREALLKALELGCDDESGICCRIAMLYSDHICRKSAEDWYKRATQADQNKSWIWILRGANLVKMGQYDLGVECFIKVASRNLEDTDEAYFNIGMACLAKGDYLKGIESIEKVLQINSAYKDADKLLKQLERAEKVKSEVNNM